MEQKCLLAKSKTWLWLPLALYVPVCVIIPTLFFTSWSSWMLEAATMLFGGGGYLIRSCARRVYRRLQAILPEHAAEIQQYKDDLSIFKWNTMMPPEALAPLAADYPHKEQLLSELRFISGICRAADIAWWIVAALLVIMVVWMFRK